MKEIDFFLGRGERGLLIGQTGSGKTQDGIYQLMQAEHFPVIVFDTKFEPAFDGLARGDEFSEQVNDFDEFVKMAERKKKDMPDYIIVRPSAAELADTESLDRYSQLVYSAFGPCMAYYDELYQWHNAGKIGPGFIGLLTRGRSKGKTVLMATQRPAWVSRFCLTEAQKFYIHKVLDARDKKALASVVPDFDKLPDPPKYHFYFYTTHSSRVSLMKPVPLTDPDEGNRITRLRWV